MADTPNLGLHQWDAGDAFLREEFNEDHRKIDTGIGNAAIASPCVAGSFTGDGADNREIALGFHPSVVMLFWKEGTTTGDNRFSLTCATASFRDSCDYSSISTSDADYVSLTDTGFLIKSEHFGNVRNAPISYLAIR